MPSSLFFPRIRVSIKQEWRRNFRKTQCTPDVRNYRAKPQRKPRAAITGHSALTPSNLHWELNLSGGRAQEERRAAAAERTIIRRAPGAFRTAGIGSRAQGKSAGSITGRWQKTAESKRWLLRSFSADRTPLTSIVRLFSPSARDPERR